VERLGVRESAHDLRDQLVQMAFERGLLVLGAGDSTLRLSPPLVITTQQADFRLPNPGRVPCASRIVPVPDAALVRQSP